MYHFLLLNWSRWQIRGVKNIEKSSRSMGLRLIDLHCFCLEGMSMWSKWRILYKAPISILRRPIGVLRHQANVLRCRTSVLQPQLIILILDLLLMATKMWKAPLSTNMKSPDALSFLPIHTLLISVPHQHPLFHRDGLKNHRANQMIIIVSPSLYK